MTKRTLSTIIIGLITALYPLLVYFGLQHYGPRLMASVLIVFFALRLHQSQFKTNKNALCLSIAGLLALSGAIIFNSSLSLKMYPVFINLGLLLIFSLSLIKPPSVIETLARLQDPELPPEAIPYVNTITKIWCGFFLVNGSIAFYTLYLDDAAWAIYNGLLSYILMGSLFVGEIIYRKLFINSAKTNTP